MAKTIFKICLLLITFNTYKIFSQTLASTSLCLHYAFNIESSFYNPNGNNPSGGRKALEKAGEVCKNQNDGECLEYVYKRMKDFNSPRNTAELKAIWGESVSACRFYVYPSCLKVAEVFWREEGEAQKPFHNAIATCRDQVNGDCLRYTYRLEKKNYPNTIKGKKRAFNQAAGICKGGVEAQCLELVYEKFIPHVAPISSNSWTDSVAICRKARLSF